MTLVMAYVTLIAAGVAACAVVVEAVLRGRSIGTRGVWVAAMGVTIMATLFAMVGPQPVEEVVIARAVTTSKLLSLQVANPALTTSLPTVAAADRTLAISDSLLPTVWLISSLVLLVALVIGQRRFRIERNKAQAATIGGRDVLLTENLGPAVAGVRRPVVFVPRWVLALDEGSQQLLLAHEAEHVKERDTSLLLFGAVTVALTPWNPVVWWMVRRLRLAVEQDCDARVLAAHPGVRRYADLLLTAASRHGLAARLLAAHFGEHTSDLVRRIEAMTSKRIPWQKLVGATFIAATLVVVACEAPRPDPVAPFAVREAAAIQVAGESVKRSKEFSEQVARCSRKGGEGCQIQVIVQSSEGLELNRYAGKIPMAQLPEGSVDRIKMEDAPCGASSCSLIWITLKPGRSILKSAAQEIERMRKTTDEIAKLRRTLEEKIESRNVERPLPKDGEVEVAKAAQPNGDLISARFIERDGNRTAEGSGMIEWPKARVELRNGRRLEEMPNVLILSSTGTEVRRILAYKLQARDNPLDEIQANDIFSIEVIKGAGNCAPLGCPLIKLTLKEGRDAAYRKQ